LQRMAGLRLDSVATTKISRETSAGLRRLKQNVLAKDYDDDRKKKDGSAYKSENDIAPKKV